MERKNSRRFTKNNRQKEERQFSEEQQQKPQYQAHDESGSDNSDRVIVDMAQGFMEAQAKISDRNSGVNNLEIALLLEKMNNQLEEMKKNTQSRQKASVDKNNQQSSNETSAKDVQALLKSVLMGNDSNSNNSNKSNNKKFSMVENEDTTEREDQQNIVTAQTASQVLAQAQYELANELENSLKKLKQVIHKSEKLANSITALLGEKP